ncbi:hypothetical protein EBT31_09790 [bacterium]|jgi:uncharacterized protein YfeS|nr:hypothetical protein [bacterium]NBX50989.1 hypothetical protein [bacterium]
MEVTIKVPAKIIKRIKELTLEATGREITDKQVMKFLKEDIMYMYVAEFDHHEDTLIDAIECAFWKK